MATRQIEVVCEVCPTSCLIRAVVEDSEIQEFSGNYCAKGRAFLVGEIRNPLRTLVTTVRVVNGELEVVAVKTDRPIPRSILFEAARVLEKVKLEAPIEQGQIVVENVLLTGANVVTTNRVLRAG